MGTAWVNDLENPKRRGYILRTRLLKERILVIVNSEEWKQRLETFHERKIDKFYVINSNEIQKFLIVQN